jgi:hypothetical protein
MTPKSWKTMGYIIDFKNRSWCVFFSEKGAVSNFFFEKGAVGQTRLGTCGLEEGSGNPQTWISFVTPNYMHLNLYSAINI